MEACLNMLEFQENSCSNNFGAINTLYFTTAINYFPVLLKLITKTFICHQLLQKKKNHSKNSNFFPETSLE